MLVGFAQYFLIVYLFLFLGGAIAGYFFEDFPSVNIETCSIGGLVGAWRGRIKELNKRAEISAEQENYRMIFNPTGKTLRCALIGCVCGQIKR